jgi:Mechanosensitive ion channel
MRWPKLGLAIIAGLGAATAFGFGYHFSQVTAVTPHGRAVDHAIARGCAALFFVLAAYTVRRLANQLARAISLADQATASVVRLVTTIAGVVVALLLSLAILHIAVSQLALGGAITGVVLGIAAQQSLGNMFAGLVLMIARPFRVGERVRVRTGALGGPMEGYVHAMGLIYVVLNTEEGTTYVPNLTLLASGIVRSPLGPPTVAPAAPPPPATARPPSPTSDGPRAAVPPVPAVPPISGSVPPVAVSGTAPPAPVPATAPEGERPAPNEPEGEEPPASV